MHREPPTDQFPQVPGPEYETNAERYLRHQRNIQFWMLIVIAIGFFALMLLISLTAQRIGGLEYAVKARL
jgi:hypothetical protein